MMKYDDDDDDDDVAVAVAVADDALYLDPLPPFLIKQKQKLPRARPKAKERREKIRERELERKAPWTGGSNWFRSDPEGSEWICVEYSIPCMPRWLHF